MADLFLIYQQLLHDLEHAELHSSHTDPVLVVLHGQEVPPEDYESGCLHSVPEAAEQPDIHKDDKTILKPKIHYN